MLLVVLKFHGSSVGVAVVWLDVGSVFRLLNIIGVESEEMGVSAVLVEPPVPEKLDEDID